MGEGRVDGSRNCAAAANPRAEARVRSHLGLSKWHRECSLPVRVLSVPVSSFCQCIGTVRVLSVPVSAPPSFIHVPSALHSAAN
jgi:hypothetical protein